MSNLPILDKITDKTLIRICGVILYLLLAPMALTAAILLPMWIIIAPLKSKPALRTFDELANAFWFSGSAYESLSSHAWTARETWWGKIIIAVTNLADHGHCQRANEFEQPIKKYAERMLKEDQYD